MEMQRLLQLTARAGLSQNGHVKNNRSVASSTPMTPPAIPEGIKTAMKPQDRALAADDSGKMIPMLDPKTSSGTSAPSRIQSLKERRLILCHSA